jgi:hypothetical protein
MGLPCIGSLTARASPAFVPLHWKHLRKGAERRSVPTDSSPGSGWPRASG